MFFFSPGKLGYEMLFGQLKKLSSLWPTKQMYLALMKSYKLLRSMESVVNAFRFPGSKDMSCDEWCARQLCSFLVWKVWKVHRIHSHLKVSSSLALHKIPFLKLTQPVKIIILPKRKGLSPNHQFSGDIWVSFRKYPITTIWPGLPLGRWQVAVFVLQRPVWSNVAPRCLKKRLLGWTLVHLRLGGMSQCLPRRS